MRLARRIGDIKGQTGIRHLVKGSWKENRQGMDTSRTGEELPVYLPRFVICFQYFLLLETLYTFVG